MSDDASVPEVVALGGGRYLVGRPPDQRIAMAATCGDQVWVAFDGDVFTVPLRAAAATLERRARDDSSLSAPMPATVALVHVSVGDEVAPGQTLLVLEAMKMELPITAPRRGTVASIACRPGDLVAPGAPLVEIV